MTTRAQITSTGATGWESEAVSLSSSLPVSTLVIAAGQEVMKDTQEERWFNTAFCLEYIYRSIIVGELTFSKVIIHRPDVKGCFTTNTHK